MEHVLWLTEYIHTTDRNSHWYGYQVFNEQNFCTYTIFNMRQYYYLFCMHTDDFSVLSPEYPRLDISQQGVLIYNANESSDT